MRPKPTIILERYDKAKHSVDQITEAKTLFVVLYEGKPFNRRQGSALLDTGGKYFRTTYAHVGSALRTARILNKLFRTNKFSVHVVTSYRPLEGDDTAE